MPVIPKVFLDANVVIQAGKPPGGPLIRRICDLVQAARIKVLTTDLTIMEVAKKHASNDFTPIAELSRRHVRQLVDEHLGVKIPEKSRDDLHAAIFAKYRKSVADMFKSMQAEIVAIDTVKPFEVFQDYALSKGFFAGEGKRDQFPDAFIFRALLPHGKPDAPLLVVTDDGDYKQPATQTAGSVSLLRSIPDLFEHLGLGIGEVPVDPFLATPKAQKRLDELVDAQVNDWSFIVTDVEDAQIEGLTVTSVALSEMTTFAPPKQGGTILVVGHVEIEAEASYTHPDWDHAAWDSEDKVLIPFDDVSGETEITISGDFSMTIDVDDDGSPADIEAFNFEGDDFLYVSIKRDDC